MSGSVPADAGRVFERVAGTLPSVTEHTDTGGENSSAIDAAVVERIADRSAVRTDDLSNALVVVGADLTDAHHEYERKFDHTTVDGRRIYAAAPETWEDLTMRNDLGDVAGAVKEAHRAQADRLLPDETPEAPVVIGVDTAESMEGP